MAIHFQCLCGRDFSVRAKRAGKTIACPECGAPITVPELPHGERRTGERRKRDRRTSSGRTEGAPPRADRRRGDRRRRDRRARGGRDITDLPLYTDGAPTVIDDATARRTHTPADATPLPLRPPRDTPPPAARLARIAPGTWYLWLQLAERMLGAILLAILIYAVAWLFLL